MKSLEEWFVEYGDSHRNKTNKLIHWICVPLITFCVIGLLWAFHWSVAVVFMAAALLFYLRLSVRLAAAMAVSVALMLLVIVNIEPVLVPVSLTLFVIAWIFQFIGHHIEGKKPSFFKDLQFLLIGPLWVVAFLFRRFHISY